MRPLRKQASRIRMTDHWVNHKQVIRFASVIGKPSQKAHNALSRLSKCVTQPGVPNLSPNIGLHLDWITIWKDEVDDRSEHSLTSRLKRRWSQLHLNLNNGLAMSMFCLSENMIQVEVPENPFSCLISCFVLFVSVLIE